MTQSPVTIPAYLSSPFGATTFLEMSQGEGVGVQIPPSSHSHKSPLAVPRTPRAPRRRPAAQPSTQTAWTMALPAQLPAAGLLLLLLTGWASSAVLQPQTGKLAALQPWHTAETQTGSQPVTQRLRKRDTHFPICIFCCKCCQMNSDCGFCCKT
ncbi:hepcidin [Perognathus longimembris pacificus]|uniref:hepcidin n=1 Tax=Perognathus longimembris pacificus TaxID=214514 RepID=UPI002018E400|nr:hepcidin [Perognathus longimembris pacificus]